MTTLQLILLIIAGLIVWTGLAFLFGVVIGRGIKFGRKGGPPPRRDDYPPSRWW